MFLLSAAVQYSTVGLVTKIRTKEMMMGVVIFFSTSLSLWNIWVWSFKKKSWLGFTHLTFHELQFSYKFVRIVCDCVTFWGCEQKYLLCVFW